MKKKVQISIPCRDSNALVPASLAKSLFTVKPTDEYDIALQFSYRQPVDANRNAIIRDFLSKGPEYEWLIMIDDDCPIQSNLLELCSHGKPIVSAVIVGMLKGIPYPIIMKKNKKNPNFYTMLKYHEYEARCKENRLIEVDGTGMGCMAMRRDALEKIGKPWYRFEYDKNGDIRLGEDYWFCEKAQKKGYKIYVDSHVNAGHVKSVDMAQMLKIISKIGIINQRREKILKNQK